MMQTQKQEFSRDQMQPKIDHRIAVWQAYLNVLNSFSFPQLTSVSEDGASINSSRAPQETYVFNLANFDSIIDQDKDEAFKIAPDGKPYECNNMIELMIKYPPATEIKTGEGALLPVYYPHATFTKYFAYFTRLDKLMRRKEIFTADQSADLGHV